MRLLRIHVREQHLDAIESNNKFQVVDLIGHDASKERL